MNAGGEHPFQHGGRRLDVRHPDLGGRMGELFAGQTVIGTAMVKSLCQGSAQVRSGGLSK